MVKGIKMNIRGLEVLILLCILLMNVTYFKLRENCEFEIGI